MSKILTQDGLRNATTEEQVVIDARQKEWDDSSTARKLTEIKSIRLEKLMQQKKMLVSCGI